MLWNILGAHRQVKPAGGLLLGGGGGGIRRLVCSNCLDQIMNGSSRVRGVVGTEKAAAARIDHGAGSGELHDTSNVKWRPRSRPT
ncbi:MAG: hypothetical protein M3285_12905 [Actinomycetota bacterium]|nr:hypothetical protein [Actinomycetota bacterium]